MALKLTLTQQFDLMYKPESGMGYQFVEATLPDNRTKRGVVYNAELLLFEEEPRVMLRSDYTSVLKAAKSAEGEIKALRFDPRPITLRGASSGVKATPAKDAPQEKTRAGEVFKRFSAYENDNRVKSDKSLRDGTYATTEEDAKNVKTGKDAVARYALPNPKPASYRFTVRPEKDTVIQKGTVEPAFDQRGGGVEVIFTKGTTPNTVTVPPDKIPDE